MATCLGAIASAGSRSADAWFSTPRAGTEGQKRAELPHRKDQRRRQKDARDYAKRSSFLDLGHDDTIALATMRAFPVPTRIRLFSELSGPRARIFCVLEGRGAQGLRHRDSPP